MSTYNLLPDTLKSACIMYKKWKKVAKRNESVDVGKELSRECMRVDKLFQRCYNRLEHPSCFSSECCSRDDIRLFAELNKTCLYKICKRLDKRMAPSPHAREWLEKIKTRHVYDFLGGMKMASLEISLPAECPICLEAVDRVAISRCGHYVCLSCLGSMYHMRGRRGTLMNLIGYDESLHPSFCPLCRMRKPFMDLKICP
jgi:hypothetical protein